jgi:hypothetical protein
MYAISDMIDDFEADTEPITQPSPRKVCVRYRNPSSLYFVVTLETKDMVITSFYRKTLLAM